MEKEKCISNLEECLVNPDACLCLDLSDCPLIEAIERMITIKNRISPVYAIHFSGLLYHLRAIESEFKCVLYPSYITDVFWANFIPYLLNKDMALSSVKLLCSQLKMSVEWAGKHGARISGTYDDVTVPSYTKRQISLSPDEVSHIYHFNVDSISRRRQYLRTLKSVRDMFVLACNLGLRYSDLIRIDISCFHNNIFTMRQLKTGLLSRVDMNRMTIDKNSTYRILEKYKYMAPYKGCYNRYNRYLRELLQYIGEEFTTDVRQESRIGGKVETTLVPKYSLITSHTARRTFITNNVLRGYPVTEIMRASGHKTYSTFALYLCYTD